MNPSTELRRMLGRLRMRHLELLDQLGRDPNVGRCAVRLNMTQPTASKLLREIEDIFGATLFTRNRRGLSPTPAGTAMARRAGIMLAEMQATHAELIATQRGATGRLRLGVFPVAVPSFLPQFTAALQDAWPGLSIWVDEGVEHKLLAALSAGEIDCILGRVVMEMLTPDLRHEVLYAEPTQIVCGVRHPIARARRRDVAPLLAQARWVLPSTSGAVYNMVASRLALLELPAPHAVIETTSVFVTIEMLERSDLLSILPARVAQSYAKAGKVALVPTPPLVSSYPVGLVYRMDAGQTSLLRAVQQAARATVSTLGLGSSSAAPAARARRA